MHGFRSSVTYSEPLAGGRGPSSPAVSINERFRCGQAAIFNGVPMAPRRHPVDFHYYWWAAGRSASDLCAVFLLLSEPDFSTESPWPCGPPIPIVMKNSLAEPRPQGSERSAKFSAVFQRSGSTENRLHKLIGSVWILVAKYSARIQGLPRARNARTTAGGCRGFTA